MNINTHFFWVFMLILAVLLVMEYLYERFLSIRLSYVSDSIIMRTYRGFYNRIIL